MNFPATEYELVPTDFPGSTPKLARVSDTLCARMVRARLKSELPTGSGLVPQKARSGHFGWLWWGLRDDYGKFLVTRTGDYDVPAV